ncbi:hypothetical protein [Rhizobium sullae]|uniref:hypothetical protein n=1 Tax=Rhizobium sullae TaxID=50338 RepID=UPI000481FA46
MAGRLDTFVVKMVGLRFPHSRSLKYSLGEARPRFHLLLRQTLFLAQRRKIRPGKRDIHASSGDSRARVSLSAISEEYQKSANAKLLGALNELVFSRIPSDPTSSAHPFLSPNDEFANFEARR